jgi:hypothetical protein
MSRKKKKKRCRPPIIRKKGLSNGRKKVPLDGRKNEVHQDGKKGGHALLLLEPTPDREKASRSPTLITNASTRYDELVGGVGSVHREVEHPYSTQGQQLRQTQEPQNQ